MAGENQAAAWSSWQPSEGSPTPGPTNDPSWQGLLSLGASAMGPVGVLVSGLSALYSASKQAKHAKKMQKKLRKQKKQIRQQLGTKSRMLRNDMDDINVETAEVVQETGGTMGENVKKANKMIGEVIRRTGNLQTGSVDEFRDTTEERLERESTNLLKLANNNRARKMGNVINPYVGGVESSMAQIDSIDNQIDSYSGQTSTMGNIFG